MKISAQVRERIQADFERDENMLAVCSRIAAFVEAHSPAELRYLSYAQLLSVADTDPASLVAAVRYLSGARSGLLEPKFEFIDDEDNVEEISPSDFAAARRTGTFYHPIEGRPVADFEDRIFMYFVPGVGVHEA